MEAEYTTQDVEKEVASKNTHVVRRLLEMVNHMMLHNSSYALKDSEDGLAVQGQWYDLGDSSPRLELCIIGLSPLNWQGPKPGFLPNSNAAPVQEPYNGYCCPECGGIMVGESGCMNCKACGYNKCG